VVGKVAYIGATQFSSGKWIGLVLDEPKVSRIKIKNEAAFRIVNNLGYIDYAFF
jgi:dynactin complex subunit